MTPAQKQARDWIRRAVSERVGELVDQWKAAEDRDDRERIHAQVRATIELEGLLSARIESYDAE